MTQDTNNQNRLKGRIGIGLAAMLSVTHSIACQSAPLDEGPTEARPGPTADERAEYGNAVHDLKRTATSQEAYEAGLQELNAKFGIDTDEASNDTIIGSTRQALTNAELTGQAPVNWDWHSNIQAFHPTTSDRITVSTSNLAVGTDTMLAVIKWDWQGEGAFPPYTAQSPFTVVGFNDDSIGVASSVSFIPQAGAYYAAIVMPFNEFVKGAADLNIDGCQGCTAAPLPIRVTVNGTILRDSLAGNTVEVAENVTGDPWLFAFKLDGTGSDYSAVYGGRGVSHDDMAPGDGRSRIHSPGFSLVKQWSDFVFVSGYWGGTGTLRAGNEGGGPCGAPTGPATPADITCTQIAETWSLFSTAMVSGDHNQALQHVAPKLLTTLTGLLSVSATDVTDVIGQIKFIAPYQVGSDIATFLADKVGDDGQHHIHTITFKKDTAGAWKLHEL